MTGRASDGFSLPRLLGRVVLVPLALLLAALVGAAVLGTLGLERLTQSIARNRGDGSAEVVWGIFENWDVIRRLVSALTILPALALVIIGEVARLRSWLYYVAGGGVCLAILPALARLEAGGALSGGALSGGAMAGAPAALWQVFATAGFAAGFVYWLIAGRSA